MATEAKKDWAAEHFERVAADCAASVARGEHDEKCEFDVRGFYLCHCSKRRREAEGFTEPPTDSLEFPPPLCPRCEEELHHDEGFYCPGCCLAWDSDHRTARFTDDFGDDLAADAASWRAARAAQPHPKGERAAGEGRS